ncbi:hypothetical protein MKW98_019005, partial [Papaver atlanticum]
DEWVNAYKAILERSIPIEPSECGTVEVGDLVVCFQESEAQAIYFDAHVLEIRRTLLEQMLHMRNVFAGLLTRKSIEERCEQLRAGVEMGSPDYMIKISLSPRKHIDVMLKETNRDLISMLSIQFHIKLLSNCNQVISPIFKMQQEENTSVLTVCSSTLSTVK